jgi:uncharacterized membrane protein YsdA (DUF1294 family)
MAGTPGYDPADASRFTMIDPRNRPALLGAALGGVALFLVFWLWAGWSPLLAWIIGWSLPGFALYGIDKGQSRSSGWRIPEALLHGVALVGGVVGAWAGRLVFRHKTRKPVFLIVLILASVLWAGVAAWALFR